MPPGRADEARSFYSSLLGLPEVQKPFELAVGGGACFESDHVTIHLGVEPDFRPARKAHPALLVDGLAELTVRLRRAGHGVTEEPRSWKHSVAEIFWAYPSLILARQENLWVNSGSGSSPYPRKLKGYQKSGLHLVSRIPKKCIQQDEN